MPDVTLRRLAAEAASCERCPLYRDATQVVLGEGSVADGRDGFVTVHPSSVIRMPDDASREKAFAGRVEDLRKALDLVPTRVPAGIADQYPDP